MSAKYDLDKKIGEDFFTFIISGNEYIMKYPTTRDLLEIQEKVGELDETDQAKARESQETFLDWAVKYISTTDKEAPDIKEFLLGGNFKYTVGFIDMIKQELGSVNG